MIDFKLLGSVRLSPSVGPSDTWWGVTYVSSHVLGTLDENGRDVVKRPVSAISLVPTVILEASARQYFPRGVRLEHVPSDQLRMPVLQTVDPTFTIRVNGTGLEILDPCSGALFQIELDDRMAWFIQTIGTVAFVLQQETEDGVGLATLAIDNVNPFVVLGLHPGSADDKSLSSILLRSTRWEACLVDQGSPGSYSGLGIDVGDRQWTFYADGGTVVGPRTFPRPCLICGAAKVTREHCTPKWLTDTLKLEPIVAGVLCESCNNRLGQELEVPISELYKQDKLHDPAKGQLMNLWMAKTAATLGAAANLSIPEALRSSVASGQIDPGLLIWSGTMPRVTEPFYRCNVIRFAPQREELAWFIVSFEFPGFGFLVAHLPGREFVLPGSFPMTHPERMAPTEGGERGSVDEVLHQLMARIGSPIDVYADAAGRAPAPRTPRKPRTGNRA